ncbi:MAG: helix-turn-helix domain-containing protein [Candidatus Woesearchaeota archaeon]
MKLDDKRPVTGRNVYWVIAIVCLIYGGIALVIFFQQLSIVYFRPEMPQQRNLTLERPHPNSRFNAIMAFPMLATFFGSVVSILAGISMLSLLRKKEKKQITRDLLDSVILPDERLVLRTLESRHGELTQSELVSITKLSKVKVHRIVKRLASMGVVAKYPYGLTNKIMLEKGFHVSD